LALEPRKMRPQIQSNRYYDKTFIGQIKPFLIGFFMCKDYL